MIALKKLIHNRPIEFTVLVSLFTVLLSGIFVFASMKGLPTQIFQFTRVPPQELPEGVDIAGWASFDRDSYLVGESITYRVRILFRADKVEPDLDQFVRSVSFSPIEKGESLVNTRTVAPNVNEYTMEYLLQGVNVEPHTTYNLDPVVLFYKAPSASVRELQSIRIPTPSIYFSEYYPQDVSTVPLKELKAEMNDSYWLRQLLLGSSGLILFSLSLFILWRFGRKRKKKELSETEILWQEFQEIKQIKLGLREYLLNCEKIVTRLLQSRADLSATAFWVGSDPEEEYWKNFTMKFRQVFFKIYRPSILQQEDAEQATNILNETFSEVVAEDLLNREKELSFIKRIAQQPNKLTTSGICFILAVMMFTLSALPDLWLSPDLVNYNNTVTSLSNATPLIEESNFFVELGEHSENSVIKAAALYNAGTIKAHMKPSINPPMKEQELLELVFQPDITLDSYIDNEASLEMFFASAGWLLEGKHHLQDAVRANPSDEDIIRNLELITKRHNAVVATIRRLFDSMQDLGDLKVKSKLETMIDVLNQEWPDEVVKKEDGEEEKNNPTYKVSEHF
ncbi:MAG: hypothetical protein ACI9XC_001602 [Gammaproteobacteria bacterium]|jgi:hypothetical protein